ncbi:MAG: transglycosylase SLT domain-containing protein, partial [Betaproteobacteria bacterium]
GANALRSGVAAVASEKAKPYVDSRQAAKASTRVDNVDALVGAVAKRYRVSHSATREFIDAAFTEAKRNRLDPLLVIAVIAIESRFNPVAQSDQGATGLMQVIPRFHADKFSAANGETVLDPRTNIKVGAQVLKEYIIRAGNESAGLQLYNGSSAATNTYAAKVMAERQRLLETMQRGRSGKAVGMLALS